MKLPRIKLSTVCVAVGIVAVHLALFRNLGTMSGSVLGFGERTFGMIELGLLAMLDFLFLGFYFLERGPFFAGFGIGGLAAVLAFAATGWASPEWFGTRVVVDGLIYPTKDWVMAGLETLVRPADPRDYDPLWANAPLIAAYMIVLTAPMLLFASACGVAARLLAGRLPLCLRRTTS